jgi:hypothetical protein
MNLPAIWASLVSNARASFDKASHLAKGAAEKVKTVSKPSEWHLPGHFGENTAQTNARAAPAAAQ